MSQHDDTTRIETLLDESDRADQRRTDAPAQDAADRTTELPSGTPGEPTGSSTESSAERGSDRDAGREAPSTAYSPYQGQAAAPEFKSGPAPTTSVVGLLGLLTVIAVLVAQATDLDVAWNVVGPVAVVGAGVLLVVLGLAGLRGQRFRG